MLGGATTCSVEVTIASCFKAFCLTACRFKDIKEDKREELFEELNVNEWIGWVVDVIDPREISAKMLNKFLLLMIKETSGFLSLLFLIWFPLVSYWQKQDKPEWDITWLCNWLDHKGAKHGCSFNWGDFYEIQCSLNDSFNS